MPALAVFPKWSCGLDFRIRGAAPRIHSKQGGIHAFVREKLYIGALLVAIGTFHAATIRQGHLWADDFAMYVHHAQNIVEHRPYADTGYIPNPSFPVYGPRYYPPVFPILLAPIYWISGINLTPMKLEQVLFLLLSLIAMYAYWKRDLGPRYALALVAILGFAPAFWAAKENVLSDVPFLFFFYLASFLVSRTLHDSSGWWWRRSAITGLVVYLAIGTRTVGIALIAGLVLYDVLRLHTITRATAVSITICGLLLGLQRYFTGIGLGGYPYERSTPHSTAHNLAAYGRVLGSFWVGSSRSFCAYVVLALVASLVLAGTFFRGKRGLTFVEAALIPYMVIVVLWPFPAGVRVAFPVLPWIGYLALLGLKGLADKLTPRWSPAAVWALVVLIAVPYVQSYRHVDFGPIRQTAGLPEFNQLCQAVRDNTAPEDPIIYFRARALSLYTGRPASVPNYLGSETELWDWAKAVHAKYFLTTNAFHDDQEFLTRFVQSNPASFDLVYENANFKLYRIRSFPADIDGHSS
jgi:4-amino-4-deoxy-L-arabinose transferase-like glycosyltransferase